MQRVLINSTKYPKMERTRSKAKVAKAVESWKRLQKERLKETQKFITPKLEKIEDRKEDSQDPPLKDIA